MDLHLDLGRLRSLINSIISLKSCTQGLVQPCDLREVHVFALPFVPAIELLNLNDENFLSDESYGGVFVMLMIRLSENT